MADDVDPTSIPFIPPAQTKLVDGATGKARQVLTDWFEAIVNWFSKTAVDLQTKITTLEDTTGDNTARVSDLEYAFTTSDAAYAGRLNTALAQSGTNAANISDLQYAISTSDSAFAGRIDTASTNASNATANAQIFWQATSGPTGATAAFGAYLTANSLDAALILYTDGTDSYFAVQANRFRFIDTGTGVDVFSYNGTYWNFNADVRIRNQDILANAVTNSDADSGASPQSVTLDVRGSASRICITGTFDGSPSVGFGFPTTNILRLRIKDSGGATVKDVPVVTTVTTVSSTNYANYYPTPIIYYADGLSAGTYTYTIELYASTGTIPLGLTTDCSIIGIELSR